MNGWFALEICRKTVAGVRFLDSLGVSLASGNTPRRRGACVEREMGSHGEMIREG